MKLMALLLVCTQSVSGQIPLSYFDFNVVPIGWSRDGKFAYAVFKNDFDGYGAGTDFHFRLQDLRTDTILATWSYSETDIVLSVDEVIESNQDFFAPLFRQYNIQRQPPGTVLEFPATLGSSTYSLEAEEKIFNFPEYEDTRLQTLRLVLVQQPGDLKKEILYTDFGSPDWVSGIVGWATMAYKSPFENRLAIVLFTGRRGWEGLPLQARVEVIGSHLGVGFRSR